MTGVLPIVVINELCLRAGRGLTAFSDGSFVAVSSTAVTMVLRSSMVTIEALRSMLVTGRVLMAGIAPTPSRRACERALLAAKVVWGNDRTQARRGGGGDK